MEIEFKPEKNNNIIVDDLSIKYKPEELTVDGVPTIETQLREIEKLDNEYKLTFEEHNDKIYKREMKQRVKCLCLLKMDIPITINTLDLSNKRRAELQRLMYEYNDIPHEDIIKEFNEKFSDFLDDDRNSSIDYSKFPVYQYK